LRNLFTWIRQHVRPYIKFRNDERDKNRIDPFKDKVGDIIEKLEEKSEVGIQLVFKF
jgi:hypothetical protein